MSGIADLLFAVLVVALLYYLFTTVPSFEILGSNIEQTVLSFLSGSLSSKSGNQILTLITPAPKVNQSQLANFTLGVINKDREAYGLKPVSLSYEPSAQQHADSMLQYSYFSHWDIYGMKPYMRYTLLGGNQSIEENVAYEQSGICDLGICKGTINPFDGINSMEYSMMYNDSICCNNGHRDNILDPNHNQVSIGVAYNSSTIYLVEDFIDNYITWSNDSPAYGSNGEVYLNGNFAPGYSLSQIYVSYDPTVQNLAPSQVPGGSYGYGTDIAGIVNNPLYYYANMTTIVADTYTTRGSSFKVSFNMQSLVQKYKAGEYTVLMLLDNATSNKGFVGASYTIFINSQGNEYVPQNV